SRTVRGQRGGAATDARALADGARGRLGRVRLFAHRGDGGRAPASAIAVSGTGAAQAYPRGPRPRRQGPARAGRSDGGVRHPLALPARVVSRVLRRLAAVRPDLRPAVPARYLE